MAESAFCDKVVGWRQRVIVVLLSVLIVAKPVLAAAVVISAAVAVSLKHIFSKA